tara:strand:+ start:25269 stop:25583 length:315 start_codon:yes stop_codon:yes gene_type:complete
MMRVANSWWQLIDGVFVVITGFTMFDATLTVATYSIKELMTIDKVGSLAVSVVVILFWVLRYRLMKKKNAKEERKLDLEIQIREMYLNRKDMTNEIDKLFKNDM